ncbi:thiosulfate sulfurtransferase-like [Babylonia areolata]|uniref:thiosulfate sulfurtransferase-like n=1 Tax=Babylonia areolata TaxID=304850 RepID=UPI003FD34DD8
MAESDVSPLVSCEWLQGKISSGDLGDVVILDVSWASDRDCQQEFQNRHLPGARYLDVMVGPHTPLFPRNLPPLQVFQDAARAAGVRESSHVVLYSDSNNCGFFMSSRAWWTFTVYGAKRVSILNGGLQRWVSLGYATTSDTAPVEPGDFQACYNSQHLLTFEDMSQRVSSRQTAILDSRPETSFNQGHVPGAHSLPFTQLVDSARQEMMDAPDVRKVLEQAGVDMCKPFVSYCNSGMSSCTLALAFTLCGGKDFAVYHGGFTEWKTKAQDNIEKSQS